MDIPGLESTAAVRDHIIDFLRREVVGPSPGHPFMQSDGEEALRIRDTPRQRYSCGILFPRGVTYSGALDISDLGEAVAVEADQIEGSPELTADQILEGAADGHGLDADVVEQGGLAIDTQDDDDVEEASSFLPSSLGLSFLADVAGGIDIAVEWAIYSKETGAPSSADSTDSEYWFRKPGHGAMHLDPADFGNDGRRVRMRTGMNGHPRLLHETDDLALDVVGRPWKDGPAHLVTVTLLNAGSHQGRLTENCFYQCSVRIKVDGASRILPYPGSSEEFADPEEATLSLLYRHLPNYAVGHGCATDWTITDGIVREIRTETMPTFKQIPIFPRDDLEGVDLSLGRIAEADRQSVVRICRTLAEAYDEWIGERETELAAEAALSEVQRDAAHRNIKQCRECLSRILDGTSLLETNQYAFRAFQLMNRAMLEQRDHYELSANDAGRRTWVKGADSHRPSRPFTRPSYSHKTRWRPFQLAFILTNIRSMADPGHSEREIVDVIWFPTGGGKTEAYLGLAAFTILLRRLRDNANGGTTVIMRYTLRLLTTQQFQRAASLICALEIMRRRDHKLLGSSPISIGAWMGGQTTPNSDQDAVNKFNDSSKSGRGNHFILLACPWCGIEIGPREYGSSFRMFGIEKVVPPGRKQGIRFRCEDPDCDFHSEDGLPVEVVDEGIYASPPTLLIGTVDKFAMMPWNPKARRIFGIDNGAATSPPDLVIQDELHLISGPLGSMVGHYETLIDEFCTDRSGGKSIRAKIVASTATISRASQQIRETYGRASALFPPQGLKAGESFFAREEPNAEGRTYVGVMATAAPSAVTAQRNLLAALLQAPSLVDASDDCIDPYWTLMVYFNSLRELGRAATLVEADVREYLNAVWDRIGLTGTMGCSVEQLKRRRFINVFRELTSRIQNSQIPEILGELFVARDSGRAVDLCYATNMIQVGLDVPRLSLMLIVGQPKGASEYIQASSRVGRDPRKPGLVVVNCNPFKPRDRSHFENFRSFHESAYRHVEPTSVTPFSLPACERAIHAIAVALLRYRYENLRDRPEEGPSDAQRRHVQDIIRNRILATAPEEMERAMKILDRFFDGWARTTPADYGSLAGTSDDPLLWPSSKSLPARLIDRINTIRPTATSMRSVDAECEAQKITDYSIG